MEATAGPPDTRDTRGHTHVAPRITAPAPTHPPAPAPPRPPRSPMSLRNRPGRARALIVAATLAASSLAAALPAAAAPEAPSRAPVELVPNGWTWLKAPAEVGPTGWTWLKAPAATTDAASPESSTADGVRAESTFTTTGWTWL
ncbi:hypothetical protein FTX61_04305 [Nitriliruptoraceae bacterium ZYF776]|nr:hypothetical protein [Profundirhabdus halotolerans]